MLIKLLTSMDSSSFPSTSKQAWVRTWMVYWECLEIWTPSNIHLDLFILNTSMIIRKLMIRSCPSIWLLMMKKLMSIWGTWMIVHYLEAHRNHQVSFGFLSQTMWTSYFGSLGLLLWDSEKKEIQTQLSILLIIQELMIKRNTLLPFLTQELL